MQKKKVIKRDVGLKQTRERSTVRSNMRMRVMNHNNEIIEDIVEEKNPYSGQESIKPPKRSKKHKEEDFTENINNNEQTEQ